MNFIADTGAASQLPTHRSVAFRVAVLGALGWVGSASAHHSAAPHYDLEKTISVVGVVNKFELVNPHAYVYFVATDATNKTAQWRCELSAKAFLVRNGWTADTFKVGDKLTFKGSPARREDNVCVLNSFVRADGTEIDSRANLLAVQTTRSSASASTTVAAAQSVATATPTTAANQLTGNKAATSTGSSTANLTESSKPSAAKVDVTKPVASATIAANKVINTATSNTTQRVASNAAQPTTSVSPAALSADADPALSGYWVSQSGPGGMGAGPGGQGMGQGQGMGPGNGQGPPAGVGQGLAQGMGGAGGLPPGMSQPSAAGIAAAKNYDQRFDDPAIKCSIGNIVFGWTHDQNVNEITQTATTVTLKYGYMDYVRTIHLDQVQHPSKLTPSVGGHSIGHWENSNGQRTLVVDTIGFSEGVLQPMSGVMHSTQLHIVERFTVNTDGTLTRSYQVEDPLYLSASYSGSDVMARSSEPYTPYNCTELSGKNNLRS